MTRFPNQVDDRPVIFALLQMIQRQFGQLTTTQPTPEKNLRIARSRLPFTVSAFGSCQSVRACSTVNEFPRCTPSLRAPLTRRIPAASSGLRSPESAASYAKRRMAASRTLLVPGANQPL